MREFSNKIGLNVFCEKKKKIFALVAIEPILLVNILINREVLTTEMTQPRKLTYLDSAFLVNS